MLNRFLLGVCMFLVFGVSATTSAAQVHKTWVVGLVQKVQSGTVEVMGESHETLTVTLNPNTTYSRWILAKPWQQDNRADFKSLRPGVRVRIEVEPGDRAIARTVWIVVGRPGLI